NVADTDEHPLRNHLLYNSIQLHQDLDIADILRSEQDEAQKWAILMRTLKQLKGEVLWIVDNAYENDHDTLKAFEPYAQLIITSRHSIGTLRHISIDELQANDAHALFKKYYTRPDNADHISELCRGIARHALSIELLAKTLQNTAGKDVAWLRQQLSTKGIDEHLNIRVATDYHTQEVLISRILDAAFDIGNLQYSQPCLSMLQLFTYLPYQGIRLPLIAILAQKKTEEQQRYLQNTLHKLRLLGWLRHTPQTNEQNTPDTWQMHPIVQEVLWKKLPKDPKQEKYIFDTITGLSNQHYEHHPIEAQVWRPFLNTLIRRHSHKNMELVWVYNSLSALNETMGHYTIALEQRQMTLSLAKIILPAQHPDLASLYMNMATTYQRLTQYETALKYYKHCHAIREQILPAQHPDLAGLYMNMAALYQSLTQYDTALAYYERCRAIFEQILPAQHPDLAGLYMNMANTYLGLTQYDTALAYYERCRVIWEQILPTQHPDLASLYNNMANTYDSLSQYDTALAYYERCCVIFEQILPTQHPDLATLYMNMAVTYRSLTQYDTALTYYERCRAIREQILPAQHPDLASLYLNMAVTYQGLTQYDTALTYYERCRVIFEQILPAQHPDLARLYMNMANTYDSLSQYDTALAYYERCRAIREQILPAQHPNLATLYMNMANTYNRLTQYDTALTYYGRCRAIWEQILPAQHPDLAMLYANIALLYAHQSQFLKAKTYIDKAVAIYQQILPLQHPHLQKALNIQSIIHQILPNK
ncbi:MAG TPA: tetratricopeptide repeat protein, partial [Chitinophagales bacterium]|nr:tetratricopeptide repeat protein [Chitinophagales bacterium]